MRWTMTSEQTQQSILKQEMEYIVLFCLDCTACSESLEQAASFRCEEKEIGQALKEAAAAAYSQGWRYGVAGVLCPECIPNQGNREGG